MDAMLSKCGNDCAHCPTYKDNLRTGEDRAACSQGWHTYHGFRLQPEKLIPCDGCQPVDGNGTRYINCIIRRCALHNQVHTCAHCGTYPCETLTDRVLGNDWLAELTERLGPIPEADFDLFVAPYLSIPHLDAIRAALDPGDALPLRTLSVQPRLAPFPRELAPDPGLESVYQLIRDLNAPFDGLSLAQVEKHKERRSHLLKLLWSFASFGEFDRDRGVLVLEHKTYLAQKIHSSFDRVQRYFDALNAHGLHCEVIPLLEDRWLTPTGALRRQGLRESAPPWEMTMKAAQRVGGPRFLTALQTCAATLSEAYGKTAYRRFARADLAALLPHR